MGKGWQMTSFVKKKMREKDVVGIVTGVCEETFDINDKNSSNKAKYLKFHCQKVETTRNGKLTWLSRRFQTLYLETRRNGLKSGVSQIMRENWQSCGENNWHFMMLPLWFPWVMTAEIPYWWHVTTQILVVTRHQYGISVLVSQMSFCRETTVVAVQNVNCFLRLLTLKSIQNLFFKKPLVVFVIYTVLPKRFHFNTRYTVLHPQDSLKKEKLLRCRLLFPWIEVI